MVCVFIDDWIEQLGIGFNKFCNTIRGYMTGIINTIFKKNDKIQMAKR
ncbi:hypothetical protein SPBRAN_822 [uncultured Candidatus Thioglobus sp.]|nr:hypothetical protein SPBRAN_822 [uncultured Candidatus Thioglobus sp.]